MRGVLSAGVAADRALDLVVLGATGFTGRQAAAYVARHAPPGLRWGLAGRRAEALEAVRDALGPAHAERALVVVDTADEAAVDRLAARTRVLLTTVGPYAAHGSAVLGACARHGTHYVDITGESPWVRDMIDRWDGVARESGARILPFCGFDSVPSDMGAWMMADWLRRERGLDTAAVRGVFRARGGFNGGTAASALGMMERGEQRRLGDPALLDPPGSGLEGWPAELPAPRLDEVLGGWVAPFFMAPVNTKVVRRSQALLTARGQGYGPDFSWQEGMWAGRGAAGRLLAHQVALGMGLFQGLGGRAWGRALLRRLSPAPGEGPDEATMDGGFFQLDLLAEGADGRVVRGRVHAAGDPGNRNTVRMLCEAALCLCLDAAELPPGGGVWTPASALGRPYLERLRAAGMRWEVPLAEG